MSPLPSALRLEGAHGKTGSIRALLLGSGGGTGRGEVIEIMSRGC